MTKAEIKNTIEIVGYLLDKSIPTYSRKRKIYKRMYEICDLAIEKLEQKPKTGHWIHHEEKMFESAEHWECSRCHRSTMTYPFCVNGNDYNAMYYCPKCGAEMTESENKEEN